MFEPATVTWSPAAQTDRFTRFFAPDVIWESVGLGTTFEGIEASRAFAAEWLGRFDDYEADVQEILDLGDGVVFVKSAQAGRPAGSAVGVWLPREVMVHVLVWEHGMIAGWCPRVTLPRLVLPPSASPRNGGRRCPRNPGPRALDLCTGLAVKALRSPASRSSKSGNGPTLSAGYSARDVQRVHDPHRAELTRRRCDAAERRDLDAG